MADISFARLSDELKLKRLFLNCFDDTLGFVNMFFSEYFIPENTLVAQENGRAVGLCFLLPCRAEERPCFYIYGVCVDGEYRGRGIGKQLVEAAVQCARQRGGACLLHPEDSTLFSFYEKAGLSPCAYIRKLNITPSGGGVTLYPVTAQEYKDIRDRSFSDCNPVTWDASSVGYALTQETFFGGTSYKFECDGKEGIVLCGRTGGEPFIKETTADPEQLSRLCAAVQKKLGGEEVRVWLPDSAGVGERTVTGYGAGFENDVYLNLMLD